VTDSGSLCKTNEDHYITGRYLFVLFDGATGLGEKILDGYSSDSVWFLEIFERYLLDYWKNGADFLQATSEAINQSSIIFRELTNNINFPLHRYPSSGMVALTIEDRVVNLYRTGDCSIYSWDSAVAEVLFQESRLSALDESAIKLMSKHLSDGMSYDSAMQAIMSLLISNRSMMNRPGGYGVLSLDPRCVEFIDKTTIKSSGESKLLLTTDGFSAILDSYKKYTIKELFQKLENSNLEEVLEEIRSIEADDNALKMYPRLKVHDDASAMLIRLTTD